MHKSIIYCLLGLLCVFGSLPAQQNLYTNAEKHYSILFPPNWSQKTDAKGMDVMFSAPPNSFDGTSDANASVITGSVPLGASLDQFFDLNMNNLRAELKEFNVVESGDIQIDGIWSKWVEYTYDHNSTPVTIRQYFAVLGQTGYLITFAAESETYAQFKPVFEGILNSFRFVR